MDDSIKLVNQYLLDIPLPGVGGWTQRFLLFIKSEVFWLVTKSFSTHFESLLLWSLTQSIMKAARWRCTWYWCALVLMMLNLWAVGSKFENNQMSFPPRSSILRWDMRFTSLFRVPGDIWTCFKSLGNEYIDPKIWPLLVFACKHLKMVKLTSSKRKNKHL